MGNTAISVENLGKCYRIGHAAKRSENLREAVRSCVRAPFHYLQTRLREPDPDELIWALKEVSFEVKHGEVLGIIGRNGAGKSTLLKILSRITEPTEGYAKVCGRVGSLLEVGTGFHPELTGRENIYLNGAILGMRRTEINKKLDGIIDFSGVEKFVDMPVKRYSSGMRVRLAFSVAAYLEPEVLLVDEVLAVGDAEFQKKCLGKMENVATKEGRTILFVSHNMVAVQMLCHNVLWLQKGKKVEIGEPKETISKYLKTVSSAVTEQEWKDVNIAPGNEMLRLQHVCVRPETGLPTDPITMMSPFVVEVDFWNLLPETYIDMVIHFYTEEGILAFGSNTIQEPSWHGKPFPEGLFRSVCYIPGNLLNSGKHSINLLILKNQLSALYLHDNILSFDIVDSTDSRGAWYGKLAGVVRPMLNWKTEYFGDEAAIKKRITGDQDGSAL